MAETAEEKRPAAGQSKEKEAPAESNGAPETKADRKQAKAAAKADRKAEKEKAKAEKAAEKAARKGAKGKKAEDEPAPEPDDAPLRDYRRIGHKGADSIVQGNTIESFEAAVEVGAEIIEFDVLRTRDGRLVVAHDYHDASVRRPLSLSEVLDAFRFAPLDDVEIDCDLKLPGREAELAGALAGHGLTDRAMISTMEVESLVKLRRADPDLRLGWTIPKTRRDWTKEVWARPVLGAGLYVFRRRLPGMIRERARELDVEAVWAYHWIVTPEAVQAAEEIGVELYAWTVDDRERVDELADMGVHGIVSNDPRLLI